MPAFNVNFSILDPSTRKGVFFKQDGKRFGAERTVKFCTDVKYEITVTVKPSVAPLRNLVIGGDDLTPDSSNEKNGECVYKFSWFTNGYTPTHSGQRHSVRFSFIFDGAELATNFQTKFYAVTSGNHLTWGTEVKQIQLEGRGEFGGGATGSHNLTPYNITFL